MQAIFLLLFFSSIFNFFKTYELNGSGNELNWIDNEPIWVWIFLRVILSISNWVYINSKESSLWVWSIQFSIEKSISWCWWYQNQTVVYSSLISETIHTISIHVLDYQKKKLIHDLRCDGVNGDMPMQEVIYVFERDPVKEF